MILAINTMSAEVQFIFYLAAIICFVLAALAVAWRGWSIGWFGLALFAVPVAWNSLALA
jgi:hypothetical protein